MKKSLLTIGMLAFCLSLISQPNLSLETFATGFSRLVDITNCGDDRLFVLERNGRIRIIEANGNVISTPFLDIDPRVNSGQSEQGLLGLAFHPDYLNNGYFYVYYTDNSPNSPSFSNTKVSRFSVSDTDPNVADPNSEVILLDTEQPFSNHNGGCLKFGPDGYLYISLGDGGSSGDPQANGQKRSTFLGKMLRIDVDNGSPYAIPDDNPFADDDFTLDEIWAIGLRNAWRFSFDQVTGDLWMGDVGQNEWEEIDFQPANSPGGENYGWRCYEGDHTFNTGNCADMSTMTFPVFEYSNSFQQGCSVTGGFVYRGCEMKGLYGHYIFADYCSGKFWSITPDGNDWNTFELANLTNNNFSAFGENSAGELFVVGHGNGAVSKVVSTSGMLSGTNESCAGETDGTISFTIPTDQLSDALWSDGNTQINRTGLTAGTYGVVVNTSNGCIFTETIDIQAPAQPTIIIGTDGSTLSADVTGSTYQWYLNGNPITDATDMTYVAMETGNYSVAVIDANGCETTSEEVMVDLTNTSERLGFDLASLTPNPFENTLKLQLRTAERTDIEINLSDANGKSIRHESQSVNGFFEKEFNLQDLPSGIYFLTIKNEKGEWSEQVVKK